MLHVDIVCLWGEPRTMATCVVPRFHGDRVATSIVKFLIEVDLKECQNKSRVWYKSLYNQGRGTCHYITRGVVHVTT